MLESKVVALERALHMSRSVQADLLEVCFTFYLLLKYVPVPSYTDHFRLGSNEDQRLVVLPRFTRSIGRSVRVRTCELSLTKIDVSRLPVLSVA